MASQENLSLWNKVAKTNKRYTKQFIYEGTTLTTINAQYQLKKATEQFGEYGKAWGLYDLKFDRIEVNGEPDIITLVAMFKYPAGTFPVATDMPLRKADGTLQNDIYKKLVTDARSKALSWLGFNADVFLGESETDNKYLGDPSAFNPGTKDAKKKVIDMETFKQFTKDINGGVADLKEVKKKLDDYLDGTLKTGLLDAIKAIEQKQRKPKMKNRK